MTIKKNKFYITTTAPYVNAKPHIGFALEIVQADAIARFKRLRGFDVFFNFGTDEHGQKIYRKAKEKKLNPQKYVDEYSAKYADLKKALNLSYDSHVRTTERYHKKAAQYVWRRCMENGYIEKGIYEAKYCVGCELEKQDSELENGKCVLHPNMEIEVIKEENYFFKFSKLGKQLKELYRKYPDFVIPPHRLKEIKNFVNSGLQDFSISRLKEKMPWGVPVPNDNEHVMYVWFDALTFYISGLGWPENEKKFREFWGTKDRPKAIQVAGKDNLRQQSAMWQAILMAADLPTSRSIFIHGFITSGGQKMSKSLGNVIDPFSYIKNYGTDALRYCLLAKISPTKDSDFTKESFEQVYQADLANGLGNLVSRVAGMAKKVNLTVSGNKEFKISKDVAKAVKNYKLDEALAVIWENIKKADVFINKRHVWSLKGSQKEAALANLVNQIGQIATDLAPFLPETAEKIEKQFNGPKIKTGKSLFPRLK